MRPISADVDVPGFEDLYGFSLRERAVKFDDEQDGLLVPHRDLAGKEPNRR